jgi:hypothetical protein
MTTWTDPDLSRFGDAQEVHIAGTRSDGSLRKPVIVWLVRIGDDFYTRSVNSQYPGPVASITSTVARATTLKLVARQSE